MTLLYNILGFLMVALAAVGVVLPVLPTTPFLLLALWFFGRGSEKMRRWLLSNRVFGGYVRAWRSGRGLSQGMQVWTLLFLWSTIGFSVWVIDAMWLKISLLFIALAITVHIIMLGRRQIFVLVPTEEEARFIDDEVIICGVGMAEMAATLTRILHRRPRLLILAGIAGARPDSGFEIGDCIVAESDEIVSLTGKYNKKYYCPWCDLTTLPRARFTTVDRVGESDFGVENMEGAAFFAMCEAAGVRFLEVRAISNFTTDSRSEWRVEDAARALAAGIKQIFDDVAS